MSERSLAGAVEAQERSRVMWAALKDADPTVGSTALGLLIASFLATHFGTKDEGLHQAWFKQMEGSVARMLVSYPGHEDRKN